ncbi:MAG: hypothetical protein M1832_000327 [Thelocarpon impressellum]|nr:MAG: hypothetical protein M1832_000327 [Thelocarpon impressellum]
MAGRFTGHGMLPREHDDSTALVPTTQMPAQVEPACIIYETRRPAGLPWSSGPRYHPEGRSRFLQVFEGAAAITLDGEDRGVRTPQHPAVEVGGWVVYELEQADVLPGFEGSAMLTDIHKKSFAGVRPTGSELTIWVSIGYGPIIELPAFMFSADGDDLLSEAQQVHDERSGGWWPAVRKSAPIGVSPVPETTLRSYLDTVLNMHLENHVVATCEGHQTDFQRRILDAIGVFLRRTNDTPTGAPLVAQALILQIVTKFMTRTLQATCDSSMLQDPTVCGSATVDWPWAPRLAKKQIKKAMCLLHVDLMKEVLKKLEETLMKKTWITGFIVMMLLAMIVETLQVAVRDFVDCSIESGDLCDTHDDGRHACASMDEAFRQMIVEFHMSHISYNKRSFNPLRNLYDHFSDHGLDWSEVDLIESVRTFMRTTCMSSLLFVVNR